MWDQWSNCAGLKLVLLYIFAVVVSCSLPDRKPRLWSEVHSDNFWSPSDTPNDCIYLIFWGQQVNSSISFLYLLFDPQFSVNQMNCLTVILQTLEPAAECMMLSWWMKIFLTQFEHFSDVLMISPLFCPVDAVFLCFCCVIQEWFSSAERRESWMEMLSFVRRAVFFIHYYSSIELIWLEIKFSFL